MKKGKKLYHGAFNWYGEIHHFWKVASSPAQAYTLMCRSLAKEVDRKPFFVFEYFKGTDWYKIKEEDGERRPDV